MALPIPFEPPVISATFLDMCMFVCEKKVINVEQSGITGARITQSR
jgi:hypothetical protein